MDRRQFLKGTSAAFLGAAVSSCANPAVRYKLPTGLTRKGEKLLLANASLVDVNTGELLRERNLLLSDGKIQALFSDEELSNVAANRKIDLGGAYLMPGIINAHCHMTLPSGLGFRPGVILSYSRQVERNAEECVKHGVTTVRDLLGISDWLSGLKEKIASGAVAGPRILSCFAMDVTKGYGDQMTFLKDENFFRCVNSIGDAKNAVDIAVDNGADVIKLFHQPKTLFTPSKPLETMDLPMTAAICEQAGKRGTKVTMHCTETSGFAKGLAGGLHTFEHVIRDRLLTEEEIRHFADNGAPVIPTVSAPLALAFKMEGDPYWGKGILPWWDDYREDIFSDLLDTYCEREWARGSHRFHEKYSNPQTYTERHALPLPNPSEFNAGSVLGVQNAMALYDAGVEFGCGNDGGVPFAFPGAMWLEMVILEKMGMKMPDILKMATINNAKIVGLESSIGSIEAGKNADLLVLQDNPLESAENTADPLMVFQEGRLVFKVEA